MPADALLLLPFFASSRLRLTLIEIVGSFIFVGFLIDIPNYFSVPSSLFVSREFDEF